MELSEPRIDSVIYEHELLVKEKTSFKSVHNPRFIDLTITVFISLSGFHKLDLTL